MLELNKIHNGDCLELMKDIPDKSIDMILCDLPYGTTKAIWDQIIPFEPLWNQYERIIKDNGAIILTASQPFTTTLITSNKKNYRYNLVWKKSRPSNPFLANKQPLKYHEDICVFYKKQPTYNPIKTRGQKNHSSKGSHSKHELLDSNYEWKPNVSNEKYPSSIIEVKSTDSTRNFHPTQKPVSLFEYLIKTYTNEGETVLDNCIGSGTTAIAALNTGRFFIGIEKEQEYVDIANERIRKAVNDRVVTV